MQIGWTTLAEPGKVFTDKEMLEYLSSRQNRSDFTASMFRLMLAGKRPEDSISATVVTSTCPREKFLSVNNDYTRCIEDGSFAIFGTMFHLALEQTPPEAGILREVRFAKRFTLPSGKIVLVAGKMDEIDLDYDKIYLGDGTSRRVAMILDYKTTKTIPRNMKKPRFSPWEKHIEQLEVYRLILSDFGGPPLRQVENGSEFWQSEWEEVEPIHVEYGQVMYKDLNSFQRAMIGPGHEVQFGSLEDTHREVIFRLEHLTADELTVSREDARAETGWGFEWKCEKYCPVAHLCIRQDNESSRPPAHVESDW